MSAASASGFTRRHRRIGLIVLAAGGVLAWQWWRQQQPRSITGAPPSGGGYVPPAQYTPAPIYQGPPSSSGYAPGYTYGGGYSGGTYAPNQGAPGGYSQYTDQSSYDRSGYGPYTYQSPQGGGQYAPQYQSGYAPTGANGGGYGQGPTYASPGGYQPPPTYQGGYGSGPVSDGGGGQFRSLTPGGYFSGNPNASGVPRSIRSNNPGALNIAGWIRSFPGFAGVTQADASGNVTAIFFTPEHGVAAWFHLLHDIYGFSGPVSASALIQRYEGAPNAGYAGAIARLAGSEINMGVLSSVVELGRAMFNFEAGRASPLSDQQIANAIALFQSGQLPAS